MKKILLERRHLEIAYEDRGSGEPLLLLHAFPFDREMWLPQWRTLSETHRVVAPDFPGFGESGEPTEGFTVVALADIAADFLDAIGITGLVTVCGLSMGGYVALSLARRQPQRLRGLILADTQAEPDDEATKLNRAEMIAVAREKGAAGVFEQLRPRLFGEKTNPEAIESLKKIASRQSEPSVVLAIQALRERSDATPGLELIAVPTLVIVGEHDAITPPEVARTMADHISRATLAIIPNAGHLSNSEQPEAFNAAVLAYMAKLKK